MLYQITCDVKNSNFDFNIKCGDIERSHSIAIERGLVHLDNKDFLIGIIKVINDSAVRLLEREFKEN